MSFSLKYLFLVFSRALFIFLVFLSLFILFSFFVLLLRQMHFLFKGSAMSSPFSLNLWGTYLYFFTYSVTNILHVTVFSSQNFLVSFKQTHWNSLSWITWPLPKNLSTFFNLKSILYHGRRGVSVHLFTRQSNLVFSEIFFCIFILIFFS